MIAILDCFDNSCRFAPKMGGIRTNGGCRCLSNLDHDPSKRMHVVKAILALTAVADAAEEVCDELGGDSETPLWVALKAAGR
jgi:hypothetical protein